MQTVAEKLHAANLRRQALEDQREKLNRELESLQEETRRLEEERLSQAGGLSEEEILDFKRALTIVAGLAAQQDVSFGGIHLHEDTEPEPDSTYKGYCGKDKEFKYSFDIKVDYCYDVSPGLVVRVDIKTKHAAIAALARSMISSSEYVPKEERESPKSHWSIDWDYHFKVTVKDPLSYDDYWKERHRLEETQRGFV
jgi:hypothetical protein